MENNSVGFYDLKTFARKFYLKRRRHEKNFYHEEWKLYYTKEHKLFLLGYENEYQYDYEVKNNDNRNKKLDIYLLKIGQRKCLKKASFKYYKFVEDIKEDKLYIFSDKTFIIYDLNTGISNEKAYELKPTNWWSKLLIIDNYLIFIYLLEVDRWHFMLYYEIIDKNLEFHKNYLHLPEISYDMDDFYYSRNYFVQLTDNFFSVYSEEKNESRIIKFAEIKVKGNPESLEEKELEFFNKNEIIIKETGEINIYPINEEKCGIVFNYKNYYICNLSNMEIYLKIGLNIYDELSLLKFTEDTDKYKLYLTDINNTELFVIS